MKQMSRMPLATRRCRICGGRQVETDEVLDQGTLLLAECARCRHRWTERPRPAALVALRLIPREIHAA